MQRLAVCAPLVLALSPARAHGAPGAAARVIADLRGGPAALLLSDRAPVAHEILALRAAGLHLLTTDGPGRWLVRVDGRADAVRAADVLARGRLAPRPSSDALHPRLRGEPPAWARVGPDRVACVLTHAPGADARALAGVIASRGGVVRSSVLATGSLIAEVPTGVLPALAAHPDVLAIAPVDPALSPTNSENRTLSGVRTLQQAPYALSGAGVVAFLYDGGQPMPGHGALTPRVMALDASPVSDHATHVAGTLAGTGVGSSSGKHKGMAPSVSLLCAGFQWDSSGVPLYTNPGDLEGDFALAIDAGAHLASASLGSNIDLNFYDCALSGDYGATSALIDAIAAGALGRNLPVVWSAGNERATSRCGNLHATLSPPAGTKNAIVVGAVNANDDSMTLFSSWGPTDDGRTKPDLVAPGCQSTGDLGVTSLNASGGYGVRCGTSMAAPTVAGAIALLLQDWRASRPGQPDPQGALVRALLLHTASDRGAPGPDYQFGYGSLRAVALIDQARADRHAGDVAIAGGTIAYELSVPEGSGPLRLTLAWDDPPALPTATHTLVNDLDLVVLAPDGALHSPWTLDPAHPDAPARRDRPDTINNAEQVVVDAPMPGVWRVEVVGSSVPTLLQPFWLVASRGLDPVTPCPGDVTRDGQLNAFDFNAFVDAFGLGELHLADLDASGELDAFDFNAFIDAFNAGCP